MKKLTTDQLTTLVQKIVAIGAILVIAGAFYAQWYLHHTTK